jgi:surface antigen
MSEFFDASLVSEQPDTMETSRLKEIVITGSRLMGRAALALGMATGMVAGEAIISEPHAAMADTGGYPDADAPCVVNNNNVKQGSGYWCSGYQWGYYMRNSQGQITGSNQNSSRGFGYRNCTDWAAYRAEQLTGILVPYGSALGNATDWDNNALNYSFTVDNTPEIGDIAVWDATPTNSFGHVEVVEAVNSNGTVNTSGYNKMQDGNYGQQSGVTANHYIDLNGTNVQGSGGSNGANTVLKVIKKNQADGTNLVYWAKANDVFEEWWRSGGDGIHISPLIDIRQGDIKDIDMEIKPDGEHLLYTATAHNIWETWWYPGQGTHTAEIVHGGGNIADIQKTVGPDGTDQLYAMTDQGVDEYWWRPGQGVHASRVYSINNPVAMKKVLEPDGTQELYVADHAYAYRNWWGSDGVVHNGQPIIHIPQADITSMDFSEDANNGTRRLYVGRQQSGVWEASWANNQAQGIATWQVTGDNGVQKIQKWMDGTTNVAYVETAGGVFEYWWLSGSTAVHGAVITTQADIHDFNRATTTDGAQAVYTAANTHIYESYWFPGGNGIHTNAIE